MEGPYRLAEEKMQRALEKQAQLPPERRSPELPVLLAAVHGNHQATLELQGSAQQLLLLPPAARNAAGSRGAPAGTSGSNLTAAAYPLLFQVRHQVHLRFIETLLVYCVCGSRCSPLPGATRL